MLILLPPSEGKADGGDGPALDHDALSFPGLKRARSRVVSALVRASRRRDAAQVLELPPGQVAAVVARNKELREAPTMAAERLYTGVLYDHLALPELAEAADRVLIFSGLWGVVKPGDPIPPYRLAMGVSLPPMGRLAGFWRPMLDKALGRPDGLVVDMRSAPYAAAWRPPVPSVAVRVFRETIRDGLPHRTVVSHMAKATRGVLAQDLLRTGADPGTPEELLKIVGDLGHTAELNGTNLDVILPDQ